MYYLIEYYFNWYFNLCYAFIIIIITSSIYLCYFLLCFYLF